MKLLDNMTEKNKHKLRMGLIGVGAVIVIVILATLVNTKPDSDKKPAPISKKGKFSLLTAQVERESWVAAQGTKMKKLEIENEEFKRELNTLRDSFTQIQERQRDYEQNAKQNLSNLKQLQNTKQEGSLSGINPPLPKIETPSIFPDRSDLSRRSNMADAKGSKPRETIKTYGNIEETPVDDNEKKDKGKDKAEIILPAGSFMKGVLLNGIDAPTDMSAKAEPYPVLISVSSISTLPNRYKMNLKECMAIGAAFGNISDERAYIRMEKLSCVNAEGKTVEAKLKGHAVGEDGKLGLRGKLVSKQGQLVAQSLLAGTLSGIAKAFQPQQSVAVNLRPGENSNYVYPDPSDITRSALSAGAETSLGRVADYYLALADKILPIIEVSAARKVDIMVLDSTEITDNSSGVNTVRKMVSDKKKR